MLGMLRNKKAQAATELAVLGSLVIMAFSYLILYSERINRQQSYLMQAFRAALSEAYDRNGSASVTTVSHRRMANIAQPLTPGGLETFSGSGSIYWGDGTGPTDSLIVYKLNDKTTTFTASGDDDDDVDSDSSLDSALDYTSVLRVREVPGGAVNTTRVLNAKDTITYSATGSYPVSGTFYLGAGGKYYSTERTLHRDDGTWNSSSR